MSETPRSDNNIAFIDYMTCGEPLVYTYASFSRQLETELANSKKKVFAYKTALEQSESELAEARAEIERLTLLSQNQEIVIAALRRSAITKAELIEQMRVALLWLYRWVKAEAEHFQANTPDDEIIKDVETALSASERITHETPDK